MASKKVQVYLRGADPDLVEHFSKIPEGDYSAEGRRLMKKAVEIEKHEAKLINSKEYNEKE